MSKVSKVKVRISERNWTSPDANTLYFVKVEMENGDIGDIMRKATGEVSVGEELDYDIVPAKKDGEFSIKLVKKFGAFGGGAFAKKPWVGEDQEAKIAGISFGYAKDLCVAGKIEPKQMVDTASLIATSMQALTAKLKTTAPKPTPDAAV